MNRFLRIAFLPFLLLVHVVEKLSGQRERREEQVHNLVDSRPAMLPDGFLSHFSNSDDLRVALAVRHAFAQATGLPVNSIYPSNSIRDLGRLQFDGLDVLDIIFRTEKIANVHIDKAQLMESFESNSWDKLLQFATLVAQHSMSIHDSMSQNSLLFMKQAT
ncbi:MAG: hypothetical protein KDA86_20850 [Planctomycetaceae bacterium]|nr:hypothetical protein [Planctomycetaceae bacterium]